MLYSYAPDEDLTMEPSPLNEVEPMDTNSAEIISVEPKPNNDAELQYIRGVKDGVAAVLLSLQQNDLQSIA